MQKVDVYLRVRRAVMAEGMSVREAYREFGLHRDTVREMLGYPMPPGDRPPPLALGR
jgi:transposase